MSPVRIVPNEQQQQTQFAKLFEESMKEVSLKEGEIVKGKVVSVGRDYVIVDIGFKSEGQVPIQQFKGPSGVLKVAVNDVIDVFIEQVEDEAGMLVLSKERADGMRTWDRLAEIEEKGGVIEGMIVAKVKGGLSVDIGVRAFLPGSQLDLRPVRNLDKYLGQVYQFRIIKLNKRRGNVVLSRKAILEKEREVMRKETLEHLTEGQVFNGIIKNITDYGVFVDLGGVDGLLHITDMSWGRINHPSELYAVGDDIRVVILKYDAESQKVSLGLKQLQPDPWQNIEEQFPVGSRVHGKVVSLTDYGAFISLHDGVEGLIHISEMSWSKKIKHPSKVLSLGQEVDAVVLDVDLNQKRISLGLKQILPNPWLTLEEKYQIGSKVHGTVRNIADFGVFVDVGAEIDGLIHISDLRWVQNFGHPSEIVTKGEELDAVVLHIDPENERFSLGVKQLLDDPWGRIQKQYKVGTSVVGRIVSANSAGAVVQVAEGIEGLLPKGFLPEGINPGDEIEVIVQKLHSDERQFLLGLREVKAQAASSS